MTNKKRDHCNPIPGVLALSHNTSREGLFFFLKDKALLTPYNVAKKLGDKYRRRQFNGVYMSMIREDGVVPAVMSEIINVIFSVSLLQRRDYHINQTDQWGWMTETSYTADNVNIKKLREDHEIVFHNNVPTIYIEKILFTGNHKNKDTIHKSKHDFELFKGQFKDKGLERYLPLVEYVVPKKVPDKYIPSLMREVLYLPKIRLYNKFCNTKKYLETKFKPRFCTVYSDDAANDLTMEAVASGKVLQKIAMNCGINNKLTQNPVGEDGSEGYEKLKKLVFAKELEFIKNPGLIPEPKFLPPFI